MAVDMAMKSYLMNPTPNNNSNNHILYVYPLQYKGSYYEMVMRQNVKNVICV